MAMPPPPPMSQTRLEDGLRPGGPPPPDAPVPKFMVYMNVISTVTHLLLGAIAFLAFVIINIRGTNHPVMMSHVYLTVIGYTILMSQALFSLKPQMGWAGNFKYPQKTKISWLLQIFGSLIAVIGCIMAVVEVENSYYQTITIPGLPGIVVSVGWNHLSSAHAIIGFIAMILTTVSLVGGLAHFFNKNIQNNSMLVVLQSCAFTLTIVVAFLALCLGIHEHRIAVTNPNANMGMAFTILVLLGMFLMMVCNQLVGGKILI